MVFLFLVLFAVFRDAEMWIYIFGSLSRGEIDANSDVDTLCICQPHEKLLMPKNMQNYSEIHLKEMFNSGELFAHHLYLESKLVYSSDGVDIIREIGKPATYKNWKDDFESFIDVALFAITEILTKGQTVFRKGLLYMSLRDIAMIYSQIKMNTPNFSKYSPYHTDISLDVDTDEYEVLRMCRISSTRGISDEIIYKELSESCFNNSRDWVIKLQEWKKSHA